METDPGQHPKRRNDPSTKRNAMHDFDALRALLALQQHGTLSAAAGQLGCPKSTLSRRLASLENTLGHRLTRPEGSRLALTEAGREYARYGQRILDLAHQAHLAVEATREAMTGTLRVGIGHGLGVQWATGALNAFLERHPGIRMEVTWIPAGIRPNPAQADLWLCCAREEVPGLHRIPLGAWRQEIYAAAGADCPEALAPETLAACPWMLLKGTRTIPLRHRDSGQEVHLTPEARMTLDTLPMLAAAIAGEGGIGLLPRWYAQCPRHGLHSRLRRILKAWEPPPVELALYLPPPPRSRRLQALADHLQAQAPGALPSPKPIPSP